MHENTFGNCAGRGRRGGCSDPRIGLRGSGRGPAAIATVLRVVDGDTVDVVDDARGRLRVRVLGIDTPETKRPGYTQACWGRQATEFATATLLNRRVALIADASQDAHDRYRRTYLH